MAVGELAWLPGAGVMAAVPVNNEIALMVALRRVITVYCRIINSNWMAAKAIKAETIARQTENKMENRASWNEPRLPARNPGWRLAGCQKLQRRRLIKRSESVAIDASMPAVIVEMASGECCYACDRTPKRLNAPGADPTPIRMRDALKGQR